MARLRIRNWRISVDGIEELIDMFDEMQSVAENILTDATKAGAEISLQAAKQLCPVDTGKLKSSLDIKQEKTSKPTKKYWRVYSKGVSQGGVRYAFAVEAGTSKQKGTFFLRRSADMNKDKIKDAINNEISRALGSVR